jgi:hypothetical protein
VEGFRVIGIAIFGLGVAVSTAHADWRDDLQSRIEARYKLARLSFLRDNVAEQGTVLLLRQPGVVADRQVAPRNEITAVPGQALTLPPQATDAKNPLAVLLDRLEPVFVTDVLVSKNRVWIQVATSARFVAEAVDRNAISRFVHGLPGKGEIVNRVDISTRRATLVFDFGSSELQNTPVDTIFAAIDLVLLPEGDSRAPELGAVSVGMSKERVLLNLGPPRTAYRADDRDILVYDRVKVTLVADRVVSVD